MLTASTPLLLRALLLGGLFYPRLLAKGSAPVYEDPFDVGCGGASLTRASQAGMIFSNPALMAHGPGFHRWAGNEANLIVGKDSVDFARSMRNGGTKAESTQSSQVDFINKVLKTPVHVGLLNNFSYINQAFGFSVFNRGEFDISAKKFGETGLPMIRFRAESYQGFGLSGATLAFSRKLSLGVTGKYLYAGEPDLTIDVSDQAAIKNLQTTSGIRSLVGMNTGTGFDAGLLLFLQGLSTDYRLALKVDDAGGTTLNGDGALKELKQTFSLGLGYTLHDASNALHLSMDYRDVQNAYQEELFKRVRMGAKLIFSKFLAVGAGYYDGWPSYAVELDTWVVRLTGAYYTRELGAKPGIDPRPVYALGFTMGF